MIPIVGVHLHVATLDLVHFPPNASDPASGLAFITVPLWDMAAFTPLFVLAVVLRRQPEFHRRLMYLATCTLTDAGFGRFPVPEAWFNNGWFYGAMDALVLAAIARDLIVQRRIHPPTRHRTAAVDDRPVDDLGAVATHAALVARHPPRHVPRIARLGLP